MSGLLILDVAVLLMGSMPSISTLDRLLSPSFEHDPQNAECKGDRQPENDALIHECSEGPSARAKDGDPDYPRQEANDVTD